MDNDLYLIIFDDWGETEVQISLYPKGTQMKDFPQIANDVRLLEKYGFVFGVYSGNPFEVNFYNPYKN